MTAVLVGLAAWCALSVLAAFAFGWVVRTFPPEVIA